MADFVPSQGDFMVSNTIAPAVLLDGFEGNSRALKQFSADCDFIVKDSSHFSFISQDAFSEFNGSPYGIWGIPLGSQSQQQVHNSVNDNSNSKANRAVSTTTVDEPSAPFSLPSSTSLSQSSMQSQPRGGCSSLKSDAGRNKAPAVKHKKAAHNAIEKRYRANMNNKFQLLSDAVLWPVAAQQSSGRVLRKRSSHHSKQQQQQTKSDILTGALDYIHALQKDNSRLRGEIWCLRNNHHLIGREGAI